MYAVMASFHRGGYFLDASQSELYIENPELTFTARSRYAFTVISVDRVPLHNGARVFIRSHEGTYLHPGPKPMVEPLLPSEEQIFVLENHSASGAISDQNLVAIRAFNGKYVQATPGWSAVTFSAGADPGERGLFTFETVKYIRLRTEDGRTLSLEDGDGRRLFAGFNQSAAGRDVYLASNFEGGALTYGQAFPLLGPAWQLREDKGYVAEGGSGDWSYIFERVDGSGTRIDSGHRVKIKTSQGRYWQIDASDSMRVKAQSANAADGTVFTAELCELAGKPLNIAAFGDSIMWGQGLHHNEKFAYLAQKHLERVTQRVVQLFMFAHSGAIVGEDGNDRKYTPVDDGKNLREPVPPGEINLNWPTIPAQMDMAEARLARCHRVAAEEIGLVLLDGGINDVSVMTILDPRVGTVEILNKVRNESLPKLDRAIGKAMQMFPNAKVIVTDYYPIISRETKVEELDILLKILDFYLTHEANPYEQMIDQSLNFACEINQGIRALVEKRWRDNPASRSRLALAPCGYGNANAYAASQSLLWKLQGIGTSFSPGDPYQAFRWVLSETYKSSLFERNITMRAAIGHPTPQGAARYGKSVIEQLDSWVPQWNKYSVEWHMLDMPQHMSAGARSSVKVGFWNRSAAVWPKGPIKLAYHIYQGSGSAALIWDGERTELPKDIYPGEYVEIQAAVQVPAVAGHYGIRWDLVEEQVAWFGEYSYNWCGGTVYFSPYHVRWDDIKLEDTMKSGSKQLAKLSLTNTGIAEWPAQGGFAVRMSYHWRLVTNVAEHEVPGEPAVTNLPQQVNPQQSVMMEALLLTPEHPGYYTLYWDLQLADGSWLSQQGAPQLKRYVTIIE